MTTINLPPERQCQNVVAFSRLRRSSPKDATQIRRQSRAPLSVCVFVLFSLMGCAEPDLSAERIALIKTNMQRSDYGAASLELANLIQAKPDNIEARLLQGKVSLAAGRGSVAEKQLVEALNRGAPKEEIYRPLVHAVIAQGEATRALEVIGPAPTGTIAYHAWLAAKGLAAIHSGDFEGAEKAYRQLHEADSLHLDGMLGLAAVAKARGEFGVAERHIQRALKLHPLSIAVFHALGELRFEQNRLIDAERAFIDAIEGIDGIDRSHEYMNSRAGLIETQWLLDKRVLAGQNTKDLIDAYPWHPLPRYLRGLLAYLDQEYSTASDYLERVTDSLPNHQPSLKLLAAAYAMQDQFGRSSEYLDRYFEFRQDDPEMIELRAEIDLKMGNADRAANGIRTLALKSDASSTLLDLYGTACRYAPDCSEGTQFLRAAVDIDPNNIARQTRLAAAHLNDGDLAAADNVMSGWNPPSIATESSRQVLRLERFIRSGQTDRASEYARKLRREDPSDLHALLALAELALHNGDIDQSIRWLELARERNPNAAEPRVILATIYLRQNKSEEALQNAQEAASAHPYNSHVLRLLADALIEEEQLDGALAAAKDAQRMSPNSVDAKLGVLQVQLASKSQAAASTLADLLDGSFIQHNKLRALLVKQQREENGEFVENLLAQHVAESAQAALVNELRGDLKFIAGEQSAAHALYAEAMSAKPNQLRAMKMGLSAATTNANALRKQVSAAPKMTGLLSLSRSRRQ